MEETQCWKCEKYTDQYNTCDNCYDKGVTDNLRLSRMLDERITELELEVADLEKKIREDGRRWKIKQYPIDVLMKCVCGVLIQSVSVYVTCYLRRC